MTGPVALAGERDHLLAAIEDLDREWEAGAIDEADYQSLRASYVARAASVIRALEEAPPPPAAPSPRGPRAGTWARLRRKLGRRRSQRALAIGAAACFVVVAAVFSVHLAGVRLPGQSAPPPAGGGGAGSARVERQLREAYVLGSAGKVRAAETLYEQVLAVEPHQPEALAYGGWLLRLLGIATGRQQDVRLGDALVAEAARVDPSYPDARAFFAIALYADRHQASASVTELRAFLADHPRALLVKLVAPVAREAFAAAGDALPASFGRRD